MHLAQVESFTQKFELFITYPSDADARSLLRTQIQALFDVCPHTSFLVAGRSGWAFFPMGSESDDGSPNPLQNEAVKSYLTDRLMSLLYREVQYETKHSSFTEHVLLDGVEIHEYADVECEYFYDNISWYK